MKIDEDKFQQVLTELDRIRQLASEVIKPEPPKPREFWLNDYGDCCTWNSSLKAANDCAINDRIGVIHVREVLE